MRAQVGAITATGSQIDQLGMLVLLVDVSEASIFDSASESKGKFKTQ